MDTVRLSLDQNGNSVPAPPYDDENSVTLTLSNTESVVSPVLTRGMYEVQLFEITGRPVWMKKTDDAESVGPYKGRLLFPGSDGVQYVTGGRRVGFSADYELGWGADSSAIIVLVPLEEVV